MTKPIVALAIMQLIEKNEITLEDALDKFLPQFSNMTVLKDIRGSIENVEDAVKIPTIKDLLLHTAGFTYNQVGNSLSKAYDKAELFYSQETTLEEEISTLSTFPLLYQPSTQWHYSVATDVLGRIIEVITNKSLREVLKEQILDPIGMKDTDFFVPEEKRHRLMETYEFDLQTQKLISKSLGSEKISNFSYPSNKPDSYARGGHGLFSSLNDYSLFSQMLLTGKTKAGNKIISSKTLQLMTKNHLPSNFFPLEIKRLDEDLPFGNDLIPYGWGLGFRVLINLDKAKGIGSVGEFGWGGAAATFFLVDPKKELSAVLMTQVINANQSLKNEFVKEIYSNLI